MQLLKNILASWVHALLVVAIAKVSLVYRSVMIYSVLLPNLTHGTGHFISIAAKYKGLLGGDSLALHWQQMFFPIF